ncbi:MAG: hypothetical protein JY451_10940 [Erythrobacter sp.]|nr:MAG: hypothetical protein JY451_10940 [Erythrobacter sp.]
MINGDLIEVTSAPGFLGSDTITYTLSDGTFTDTATISLAFIDSPYSGFVEGTESDDELRGDLYSANLINALGGDDLVVGGGEVDRLVGGRGDDALQGRGGDDELWGNEGNDFLYGGLGIDTAHYSGFSTDYVLDLTRNQPIIRDNRPDSYGNDGQDWLIGIERLYFAADNVTISLAAPIVLDLDRNGIVTSTTSTTTAAFDFDGDGRADRTAWIGAGDAFLFIDRDGDGTVSDAGELSFLADSPGALTDLAGLRSFDSSGDGVLDTADHGFGAFGVWQDADSDGVVDEDEVSSLVAAGIAAIGLSATLPDANNGIDGVTIVQQGSFTFTDGTSATFYDAALAYVPTFASSQRVGGGNAVALGAGQTSEWLGIQGNQEQQLGRSVLEGDSRGEWLDYGISVGGRDWLDALGRHNPLSDPFAHEVLQLWRDDSFG